MRRMDASAVATTRLMGQPMMTEQCYEAAVLWRSRAHEASLWSRCDGWTRPAREIVRRDSAPR